MHISAAIFSDIGLTAFHWFKRQYKMSLTAVQYFELAILSLKC